MLNQKGFAHLLLLVLLVAGLGIGLYLVTQTQIFKSRAGGGPISFNGPSVKTENGKWVSSSLFVGVTLTSPFTSSPSATIATKRISQTVVGKDGRTIFSRDCPLEPNKSPWKLGNGFDYDAPCPWVAQKPLPMKVLNYDTVAYYRGGEQRIFQNIIQEVNNTRTHSYIRDCVLPTGKKIQDLGDGFDNSSACKWVSMQGNLLYQNLSTTTYVRDGNIRVAQTALSQNFSTTFVRDCHINDLSNSWVLNNDKCPFTVVTNTGAKDPVVNKLLADGFQVNDILAYKRDNKDYLYQIVVNKDGDKLYYKECEYNPNSPLPISISGTSFMFNQSCVFLGPYFTADSRFKGGLVENSTVLYDLTIPSSASATRGYKIGEHLYDLERSVEFPFPQYPGDNQSLNTYYNFKNIPSNYISTLFVTFIAHDGRTSTHQQSIEIRPRPLSEPIPTGLGFKIIDDFNRKSTGGLGSDWTVERGQFSIQDNQAVITSGCPAPGYALKDPRYTGGLYEITITKNKQDARIPYKYHDQQNYAWVELTGDGYQVKQMVNGVQSTVATSSEKGKDGDKIGISFFLREKDYIFLNGNYLMTAETIPTGTKMGFGTWCDNSMKFDDFVFKPNVPTGY